MTTSISSRRCGARAERGASMLFALMALVVMALAAVGLVRSVDTNALVLGNLGFKQDATTASAAMAEQAITWLQANPNALDNSSPAGYSATSLDRLDVTGNRNDSTYAIVDWDTDKECLGRDAGSYSACIKPSAEVVTADGNRSRYLIARLCAAEGPPGSTVCTRPAAVSTAVVSGRGSLSYGSEKPISTTAAVSPYYRVIVRTLSGRNTVSYTETLVHF